MRQLGELVTRVDNHGPDPASDNFTYIDLSSVSAESKSVVEPRELAFAEAPSRARQRVKAHDVLFSTVRPNLNGVAMVPDELEGSIASTGFCVLRSKLDELHPRYLFHWVRSDLFVKSMTRLATGASYPAVSDSIVKGSSIPLPPLPEQRRIADILDRADDLRAHRRRAKLEIDRFAESVFDELFGDPMVTARHPDAKPLSSITTAIIDCPHTTPNWTEEGVLCLRTPNLGKGNWDFSETRFVSVSTHDVRTKRGELEAGDIILSREGTVGVAAIVPDGMRASMGQRLVQVKPQREIADEEFLLAYLLEVLQPERLTRLMVGSTARHLNVKDLRTLRVLVPPLAEQRKFALLVYAARSLRAKHADHLEKLDELFASLQQRAFQGEL